MDLSVIRDNEKSAAVVNSQSVLIYDVVSALDFAMSVKCETGCTGIALNKESVSDEFFALSTRLAGEILQKFVNYGIRLAVYGDFSEYASSPLRDFMYESNKGSDFFFQPDADLAAEKLLEKR